MKKLATTWIAAACLTSLLSTCTVASDAGNILYSHGEVSIFRSRQPLPVGRGTAIQMRDVIRSENGAWSCRLGKNCLLTAGPHTLVQINGRNDSQLELQTGEIRIACRAGETYRVVCGNYSVQCTDVVARLAADHGMQLYVESGQTVIQRMAPPQERTQQETRMQLASWKVTDTWRVDAGQEVAAEGDSAPVLHRGLEHVWTVDPQALAMQNAADCSRQLMTLDCPESGNGCDRRKEESDTMEPPSSDRDSPTTDVAQNPPASPRNPSTADRAPSPAGSTQGTTKAGQDNIAALSNIGSLGGSLGSLSFGAVASGGGFTDANQGTLQGQHVNSSAGNNPPFPGGIHLVTAETNYGFSGLQLNNTERAAFANPQYWSIGLGASPTTQVQTDLATGTSAAPNTVRIPHSDAYLVQLDQYGAIDYVLNDAAGKANDLGVTGFLDQPPTAPSVLGATPLQDTRGATAGFNPKVTFALGEFRVDSASNGDPQIAVRRSAQDRTITKDGNGNDANDLVTTNPEVQFENVQDPRFFPAPATVKVPVQNTFSAVPTNVGQLDTLRRAAMTTLTAEKFHDFARRTGQTRFVMDGKVVDISGYKR